ncbi:MAG TPA: hypothetical protein VLH09_07380 [Bryobacteraceae bacterium]|nr:hypothetical protein [Bryobacteraceae bacterium]
MHTLRHLLAVVSGCALLCTLMVLAGLEPAIAKASAQAKEQAYEAQFECTIPSGAQTCSVTMEQAIPAWMRLKITSVKGQIIMPSRVKSGFGLTIEFADPSAEGGVRSIRVTPTLVGPTEGRFYNIWAVDEKLDAVASRTDKLPAPRVLLSNPEGDPLYSQYGTVREGVLAGTLVPE